MIFVDGYVPVSDVTIQLVDDNKRMHAVQCKPETTLSGSALREWSEDVDKMGSDEGIQNAWSFFENSSTACVVLPTGNLARVSNSVFQNEGVFDPVGLFIDLYLGTLGSGSGLQGLYADSELDKFECERLTRIDSAPFGCLTGLAVVVSEKEFRAYFDRASQWEGAEGRPDFAGIIERIVSEFDRLGSVKKADMRKLFAPHMKSVEFNETWKLACKERPALSKPGPRPLR